MADSKKGVLRPQMLNVPDGFKRSASYEGQINWLAAASNQATQTSAEAFEAAKNATQAASDAKGFALDALAKVDANVPYVTPEMFGAVGDGVADDTEAVQRAIDESISKRVCVKFSNKTYFIRTLTINDTDIYGPGKIIFNNEDEVFEHSKISIKGSVNIYNIEFELVNKQNVTKAVRYFHLENCRDTSFVNCAFIGNNVYAASVFDFFNKNENVTISMCVFDYNSITQNDGGGCILGRNVFGGSTSNIYIVNNSFNHFSDDEIIGFESWNGVSKSIVIDGNVFNIDNTAGYIPMVITIESDNSIISNNVFNISLNDGIGVIKGPDTVETDSKNTGILSVYNNIFNINYSNSLEYTVFGEVAFSNNIVISNDTIHTFEKHSKKNYNAGSAYVISNNILIGNFKFIGCRLVNNIIEYKSVMENSEQVIWNSAIIRRSCIAINNTFIFMNDETTTLLSPAIANETFYFKGNNIYGALNARILVGGDSYLFLKDNTFNSGSMSKLFTNYGTNTKGYILENVFASNVAAIPNVVIDNNYTINVS